MLTNFIDEAKKTLFIAIPLVGALLAQRTLQVVDTIMMGWLGAEQLASGALVIPAYALLLVICMGIASATGIFIARAFGENNIQDVKNITKNFIFITSVLSLPVIFIASNIPDFFLLIGQELILVQYTRELTAGILWGLPALVGFFLIREFLANVSKLKVIVYLMVIAIPLNGLLNYALMYGLWFIPPLGILGIGYATSITEWLVLIALIIYIITHPQLKPYLPKKLFNKPDFSLLKQVFVIGLPSGFTISIDIVFITIVTIFMGYIGITSLAAHQIIAQVYIYVFMAFVALGTASGIRISYYLGSRNHQQIIYVAKVNIALGLIAATIIAIIFALVPQLFIHIFITPRQNHYYEILTIALGLFTVAIFALWGDVVQTIMIGILRGFKDTLIPMLLAFISYWIIGISSAYYLAFYTPLSSKGLWLGFVIAYAVASILLSVRFYFKYQQLIANSNNH